MAGTSKSKQAPDREFIKLFESLTHRYYNTEVFRDFLDYGLTYFIQGATSNYFEPLEKKWKGELSKFQQMFLLFGEMADKDGTGFYDPLGDVFMEIIAPSDAQYKGQFFTPQSICDMIAQMTYGDDLKDGMRVSDPACGSGRTLLAMAKLNRNLIFYAADVDQTCCKMTLLNMLANSLTCEVAWMNSISMEHYGTWHTATRPYAGMRLPYYVKVDKEHTYQIQMWEQQRKEWENKDKTPDGLLVSKHNQITLF